MSIVIEQPQETILASWESALFELSDAGVTSAQKSDVLRLLRAVSGQIDRATGRVFARGRWQERVQGGDSTLLALQHRPVAEILSLSAGSSNLDVAALEIAIPDLGTSRGAPWERGVEYTVDYRGGYLLPSQAFETAALAATAATDRLTLAGGYTWPKQLVGSSGDCALGDWIVIEGVDGPTAIDGMHLVSERVSDTVIEIDTDIASDFAAGPRLRVDVAPQFPPELITASLLLLRQRYHATGRDPTLAKLRVDSEAFEWDIRSLNIELASLLLPFAEPGSPLFRLVPGVHDGGQYATVRA